MNTFSEKYILCEDFNEELFECTVVILSLLKEKYNAKQINLNDFRKHSTIKINYILKNINFIKDAKTKIDINNLLNECLKINNTYLKP